MEPILIKIEETIHAYGIPKETVILIGIALVLGAVVFAWTRYLIYKEALEISERREPDVHRC